MLGLGVLIAFVVVTSVVYWLVIKIKETME